MNGIARAILVPVPDRLRFAGHEIRENRGNEERGRQHRRGRLPAIRTKLVVVSFAHHRPPAPKAAALRLGSTLGWSTFSASRLPQGPVNRCEL